MRVYRLSTQTKTVCVYICLIFSHLEPSFHIVRKKVIKKKEIEKENDRKEQISGSLIICFMGEAYLAN